MLIYTIYTPFAKEIRSKHQLRPPLARASASPTLYKPSPSLLPPSFSPQPPRRSLSIWIDYLNKNQDKVLKTITDRFNVFR